MTSADFLPSSRNRKTAKETDQGNNGEWAKWKKRQLEEEEEEEEENVSRKPESGRDYDRVRGITRITVGSVGLSLSHEERCD